jgi:hypothetical protein
MEQSSTMNTEGGNQRGILDRVREQATAQLTTQKDRATDGLGNVAQAVRQSTQQLRDQQHETIAQYVEKAADQLERFSANLRNRNVTDIVDEVQRFARRQPAVFIGSAFALGVLSARFLKSSADRRHAAALQRYDRSGTGGYDIAGDSTRYGTGTGSTGFGTGTGSTGFGTGTGTAGYTGGRL